MNTVWSKYIQGVATLHTSRSLRFDDLFAPQYRALFGLDETRPLRILEIGCGPGTLAAALKRWYPKAEITAIDRDSDFVAFARENHPGVTFLEGDATALPFPDNTFDVTISNTVAEHIEPGAFYGEQRRVLRPGGLCLVLSARRGVTLRPACMADDEFEQAFWAKAESIDHRLADYAVCRYPMNEAELPAAMEKHGFTRVSTGYAAINLTPDNPDIPRDLAHAMLAAHRANDLDSIDNLVNALPDAFTPAEAEGMRQRANAKHDLRLSQYERGEKQWDTSVSVTMVIRGVK